MEENFVYPPVYIDRVIINSGTGNKIKNSLLLALKAPIGSETISTLSNDFLSIKILEVRDERLSAILEKSSELTKGMIENPNNFQPNVFFLRLIQKSGLTDVVSVMKFRQAFSSLTTIREITSEEIKSRDSINRIVNDENGNSVLNVYINKILPEIDPTAHLSYFVYSSYDKEKIQQQTSFTISDEALEKNTKITAETIINKGRVSSETFVYFMRDDSVWTGEVHQENGSWFTGKFSDKDEKDADQNLVRKPLRRRAYYNTKIQDFRVYKRIESRVNQYSDLVRRFENFEIIDDSYLLKTSDSPIHFGGNNNGRGIVSRCSLEDLLQRNSVAYNSIKQVNFPIVDWGNNIKVKAFRKRVREYPTDNSAQKETDYLPDFSKNEKRVYLPSQYISKDVRDKILTVTVNDRSIPENGEFCYGIELTFDDPIVTKLEQIIRDAEEQEKKLLDYSERAKVLSYSDVNGNYYEGNYDQELNRFTNKFKNNDNRGLVRDAINYFIVMFKMISKAGNSTTQELSREVFKTCSPDTGTPDSIISFLKLYRTCLSALRRILESSKKKVFSTEEKYFNRRKHKIVRNVSTKGFSNNFTVNRSEKFLQVDSTQRQIDSLSELCSLTIRKIGDTTTTRENNNSNNNGTATIGMTTISTVAIGTTMGTSVSDRAERPSLSDRNIFPAGKLGKPQIVDIERGIGGLLGGVTVRPDPRGTTPAGNPFASRGLIGNQIVITEPATKPIIDYDKSIKELPALFAYDDESGDFRSLSNGSSAARSPTRPAIAGSSLTDIGSTTSSPAVRGIIDPEGSELIGVTSTRTRVASNGLRANVTDQQPAKATVMDTGNTRIITIPEPESNRLLFFPTRQEQETPLVRVTPKIMTTMNFDSQVSDASRGLAATPAGASTNVVSSATMEEVVQEQVNKKNVFKRRRMGR